MLAPPFVAEGSLTRTALDWAADRHGNQLRDLDCAPFILHPLEVAALLHNRGFDDEVVAAGLLHDVVEDTGARSEEIRERFGARVARIVDAVTEDPAIDSYAQRKAALREQVLAGGPDAHAVYAADKVVKARELRAKAMRAPGGMLADDLRPRLEHYVHSLAMLRDVAGDLPLVRQLDFELWALRSLPPRGEA